MVQRRGFITALVNVKESCSRHMLLLELGLCVSPQFGQIPRSVQDPHFPLDLYSLSQPLRGDQSGGLESHGELEMQTGYKVYLSFTIFNKTEPKVGSGRVSKGTNGGERAHAKPSRPSAHLTLIKVKGGHSKNGISLHFRQSLNRHSFISLQRDMHIFPTPTENVIYEPISV